MKYLAVFLLLFLVVLSGCASVVSDNKSVTYIETDPENVRCELHGQDFVRKITAPGSISLPSEAAPIIIACKTDGYYTTTQEIDTKMDGWIFGNIIFGGIIGGVIDVARGAGQKFPSRVSIILDPKVFPSQYEKNEWYNNRKSSVEKKWNDIISRINKQCAKEKEENNSVGYSSEDCEKRMLEAEEKKKNELEIIENRMIGATAPETGQASQE
ncbi:hypothetical protein [Desulfocurvus sp. DL9XJH121]